MSVIGPTDPIPAAGHVYSPHIIDLYTRWAKAVSDALMDFFYQHRGTVSDKGTNSIANLAKEFFRLMACSPRFDTPGQSEAGGLAERRTQTFKKMIHHVIIDNPRQWRKLILLTVWALREIPNVARRIALYI